MVRLGDVVTVSASTKKLDSEEIWLLNLDMVEQQTGYIISYNYVSADKLNGSIIQFDTENVLYSKLRPNLNKVVVPSQSGFATSEMLPLRPDISILTREYLAAYLRSDGFVKWAVLKTSGAKMPRLGTKELLNKEVPVPTLEKQNYITKILEKIDNLISLRKQQLAKLDELVKARFVEMFGGITETVPLSYYIMALSAGKSLAGEEVCPNKVLKTGAATYDEFDPTQVKNLPINYIPQPEHLIKSGDVIISRMNTAELVGAAAYVWEAPSNTYLPDRLWRAELKRNSHPIFVWQSLIQSTAKESIRSIASGTSGSMKNISKPGLLGIHIKKVGLDVQLEFSNYVERVHRQKLTIQQSLDKLEVLKKSLMQEYFG
ncbi:restriction endonuclease subunit S [Oscillospiraceae bacterium 50-16]